MNAHDDPCIIPVRYVGISDGCLVAWHFVQIYVLLSVRGKVYVMLTSIDEKFWRPSVAITSSWFRILSGCQLRNYAILEEFRVLDFHYFKSCA